MFEGLATLATQKNKPKDTAFIRYLFFTMGISEKEFNELSLPYIVSMVEAHNYIKREEEKANKKAAGKK